MKTTRRLHQTTCSECTNIFHEIKDFTLQRQKMETYQIFKKSLKLAFKNANFIIFTIITSLPLFSSSLYYEFILRDTLNETIDILKKSSRDINLYWPLPYISTKHMTMSYAYNLIQLGFLYLVLLHILEFFTASFTIHIASKVYSEETPMKLKDMVYKPIDVPIRCVFVTFVYSMCLCACTQLGLAWLVINYYFVLSNFFFDVYFALLFGVAFVALLAKYLEWSAEWNMGVVVSILEDVYGARALALSAFFNRGNSGKGMVLMLVFFVWGICLRFSCLSVRCNGKWEVIVAQVLFLCLGNVFKWVVCMVYFHHCKNLAIKKKIDWEARG